MNIVDRARMIATAAHEGQRRKYTGEPYINHPERVAELASLYYAWPGVSREIISAVALLHDTIEDCGMTGEAIEEAFGSFTRYAVEELTKPNKPIMMTARMIKACDLIDNLSNLVDVAPADEARVYLLKKAGQVLDICEGIRKIYPDCAERLASTWKRQWDSLPA